MTLLDCFHIIRVKDKYGEHLEIAAPCPSSNDADNARIAIHVAIHPHISVKLGN